MTALKMVTSLEEIWQPETSRKLREAIDSTLALALLPSARLHIIATT